MKQINRIITKNTQKNQKGTASIVSTFIIIILLSLITISFAKIMNRSLQESLNSHLASAADYAAQSGVNDAIAFVKAYGKGVTSGHTADCNYLNGTAPNQINYNISPDTNTKYTCILINPISADLLYNNVSPYTSKVANVSGSSSLMFSWESTDNTHLNVLPPSGSGFLDETTWINTGHYAPVLRLSLYSIGANMAATTTRTYFFYPSAGGITSLSFSDASKDGTIQPVNCSPNQTIAGFTGSADYQCNVVVQTLPSSTLYVRLTPLYNKTDIKVKGNDSTGAVTQFSAQTTIDVTAKTAGATKRLQVRIDIEPEIPEYALRSTNLVCKRLTVPQNSSGLEDMLNGAGAACAVPSGTISR